MTIKTMVLKAAPTLPRRRQAICAVLLLTSCSTSALASGDAPYSGDLTAIPLESLMKMEVHSASRYKQTISEAPSAVSVITADEIKTYGWRTLGEILSSLPGMHSTNDRTYTFLGGRGFMRPGDLNPRFLLMIDGHRTNDPLYDQAMLGQEFMLDIDLIDRVEYVPGPGSSIYGSNAFFGVINVITKKGGDINGAQVSGEGGTAGMGKARATLGAKNEGGVEWLLSATAYNRDGKDLTFPQFPGQVARGLDFERVQSVLAKGSAGPFSLSLAHAERKKGTPTATYEQDFNDPRSRVRDTSSFINLGYDKSLSDKTDLSARLYYSRYRYSGAYVYEGDVDNDEGYADWWGGDVKLVNTTFDRHKLVTGIEFQHNARIKQLNYNLSPEYTENLNITNRNYRIGLYAQNQWEFQPDWLLDLGLRYDRNSRTADRDAINPRLGLIHKFTPSTTAKALFGKAYRLPNFYEMYYTDGETQMANPNLRPERIQTAELVLEHQWSPNSRLRLSTYRNKVKDLISETYIEDALIFQNVGHATVRGAEAELQLAWRSGTKLRTSVSWQQAKDDDTGKTLANAPKFLAKMNLSTPFWQNLWRAGLEVQYVGPRTTMEIAETSWTGNKLGGYTLTNLTLFSDRLIKGAELSASLYNLFNHHYGVPVGSEFWREGSPMDSIAQDGRAFRLKLTYQF